MSEDKVVHDPNSDSINWRIYGVQDDRAQEMHEEFQELFTEENAENEDGDADLHALYNNHLINIPKTDGEKNFLNFMFGLEVMRNSMSHRNPMEQLMQMMAEAGDA